MQGRALYTKLAMSNCSWCHIFILDMTVLFLQFSHVLDKVLLVSHACVLPITQNAYVPQTKFHKTFIHQVHRGAYVKGHRCLSYWLVGMATPSIMERKTYRVNVSRKVGGVKAFVIRIIDRWYIGHQTQVGFFIW